MPVWKLRTWVAICVWMSITTLISTLTTAAPHDPVTSGYSLETIDGGEIEDAAHAGDLCVVTLLGYDFILKLEPVNLRSEFLVVSAGSLTRKRRLYLDQSGTYKGTVVDDPDSFVRLTVTREGVFGYIRDSAGWVFVEPPSETGAAVGAGGGHRVYTELDISETFVGSCVASVTPHALQLGAESEDNTHAPTAAEADTPSVMELAIDADAEYFAIHGSQTTASIEAVINAVDGILLNDFNITVEIVRIEIFESEPDPYTSTDSYALLTEFRNHWITNNGAVERDVAHLFTGRDLDGSTVGRAWVGAVCNASYGYGVSQEIFSQALMPILVAHEIGHNMGASHDESGSTPRYIMYPSVGSSNLDEYSAGSIQQINGYLAGQSCLSTGSGGDPPPPPPSGGGGGGGGGGPIDPFLAGVLGVLVWWSRRRKS